MINTYTITSVFTTIDQSQASLYESSPGKEKNKIGTKGHNCSCQSLFLKGNHFGDFLSIDLWNISSFLTHVSFPCIQSQYKIAVIEGDLSVHLHYWNVCNFELHVEWMRDVERLKLKTLSGLSFPACSMLKKYGLWYCKQSVVHFNITYHGFPHNHCHLSTVNCFFCSLCSFFLNSACNTTFYYVLDQPAIVTASYTFIVFILTFGPNVSSSSLSGQCK